MGQLARAAIVMWPILAVAIVICAVLAIGAALNSGPKPQHARPRHLAAVPDPPEVGSMILAEERAMLPTPRIGLARTTDGQTKDEWQGWPDDEPDAAPDWREQTMAELSPDALEHIHNGSCADTRCWDGGPGRAHDPGPGGGSDVVSSPPSGPDQAPPPRFTDPPAGGAGDWLEVQMADLFEWVRSVHAGAIA